MDLGLKNKVALVAASSRGLGRAVAEELAAEGASLLLCARDAQKLTETAAAIAESSGAHVLAVPADVTVIDDIKRLVDAGIERFGQIDILVTNAGGPPAGTFDQLTREKWDEECLQIPRQKGARLRIHDVQTVVVDEHGL